LIPKTRKLCTGCGLIVIDTPYATIRIEVLRKKITKIEDNALGKFYHICILMTWHIAALGVASNQTRTHLKPGCLHHWLVGLLAAVVGA
jgi:hypothetical protein